MQDVLFRDPIIPSVNSGTFPSAGTSATCSTPRSLGEMVHGRYTVRFARSKNDSRKVLALQQKVFGIELKSKIETKGELNTSLQKCLHLIVLDNRTDEVVGTYRISTIETARSASGFYSSQVFAINELPDSVLERSIEISRLCILPEHRNKQVLFLLWKGLANHLVNTNKRYLFGCCSIFSQSYSDAAAAFEKLIVGGFLHKDLRVSVSPQCLFTDREIRNYSVFDDRFELPKLFGSYVKLGAKICSEPAIDREFKTIDFFMLFDVKQMSERYYKMFFS